MYPFGKRSNTHSKRFKTILVFNRRKTIAHVVYRQPAIYVYYSHVKYHLSYYISVDIYSSNTDKIVIKVR